MPSDWMGDDGRPVEPPPFVLEAVRCYGCVNKEEEQAMVPASDSKGLHWFFRFWRKDDEL